MGLRQHYQCWQWATSRCLLIHKCGVPEWPSYILEWLSSRGMRILFLHIRHPIAIKTHISWLSHIYVFLERKVWKVQQMGITATHQYKWIWYSELGRQEAYWMEGMCSRWVRVNEWGTELLKKLQLNKLGVLDTSYPTRAPYATAGSTAHTVYINSSHSSYMSTPQWLYKCTSICSRVNTEKGLHIGDAL